MLPPVTSDQGPETGASTEAAAAPASVQASDTEQAEGAPARADDAANADGTAGVGDEATAEGSKAEEPDAGTLQGAMPADLPGEGTPAGDKLRAAFRAFEAGDYVRVRELCDTLLGASKDVADAARSLRRRTEVDPMQIAVIAACLVFFLVIAYVYVLR